MFFVAAYALLCNVSSRTNRSKSFLKVSVSESFKNDTSSRNHLPSHSKLESHSIEAASFIDFTACPLDP